MGTRFRNDRPDLGLSSFADSQLIGQSAIAKDRTLAANESLSNERVRSFSASRVNSYLEDRDRKLMHSPSFDAYSSARALDRVSSDIEESRLRRSNSRRQRSVAARPESMYNSFESAVMNNANHGSAVESNGPSQNFWMERCQQLQSEVENLKCEFTNASDKVKHESVFSKNKINQDVADLMIAIEDQDRQIQNLQKQLRKQAKTVSDISLELEASQRQYGDVSESLVESNRRASNMAHEIEEMRSQLEKQHIFTTLEKEMQKINSQTSNSAIPNHYDVRRDPRFLME
ncbi:hypothetical protein RDWZM_006561 [Blomia tropicalis]|uniref:Uncharacterized protein n=1 Tax=Blomia tropicalis TaxID=40697 RepID=A0A9Q0RNG1_BLOTA|nr:hypothetical protein RDWZM_006561 [Blomia tropicalis]